MRAKRFFAFTVLAVLAAGGTYYATRPPTALVLTGIVTTNHIVVAAQVGGRLGEVRVKEGDEVAAGQTVASIAPEELLAESAYAARTAENAASHTEESQADLRYEQAQMIERVRQAESTLAATEAEQVAAAADFEAAQLHFDRVQQLSKEGVAAAQELDRARTSLQAARARADAVRKQAEALRAAVALARTDAEQVAKWRSAVKANEHLAAAAAAQRMRADVRLAYAEIAAPIAGIVDVCAARTGEVVTAGQPILTLINPDDLWVRADVEESYIDRIRVGDHLTIRLPSGADIDGEVFYRAVDAGFATQRDVSRTKRDIKTFEIRLRTDNRERRLAVGMTAQVFFPLQPSER
jgi:HlyD family secretion protein